MNPSAKGWLKKLLKTLDKQPNSVDVLEDVYPKLKLAGFIYGSNVSVANKIFKNQDYTQEERCKINLILALHIVYKTNSKDDGKFVQNLNLFYQNIGFYKTSIISGIFGEDVENIIHKRIQIDNNIFTKNFNYFVTNALLFMDVLAFGVFLKNPKETKTYLETLENTIRAVVSEALNSKSKKNKYDESLIRLLKSSLRISEEKSTSFKKLKAEMY